MSNLNPIFAQAIESAIRKTLIQGKKSVNDYSDRCAYRSDVGCCIVGHMITDENYSNYMEGADASASGIQASVLKSIGREEPFTNNEQTILIRLQVAHDTYRGEKDDKDAFMTHLCTRIARSCGPDVSEILDRVKKELGIVKKTY